MGFFTVFIAIFIILVLVLAWFVAAPYFKWQNSLKQRGGLKDVRIFLKKGESVSYQEYHQKHAKKINLSMVVPAYYEEKRLPLMLPPTIKFFSQQPISWEIIVVNDASKDKTTDTAFDYGVLDGKQVNIKVVEYSVNKGKGGAIRTGMQIAQGEYKLFLDADGATEVNEFNKVMDSMKKIQKNGLGIVAGSRNHLQQDVVKERKWYRNILMHVSNFIVRYIDGVQINDTQCGFKLFTSESAEKIFDILHLERWAFDVELFMIANKFNIPVSEIPVNWKDVDGSKLNVVEASITMARDFFLVRILYVLGIWKFTDSVFTEEDRKIKQKTN